MKGSGTCMGLRCFAGVPGGGTLPMVFLCDGCSAKLEPQDWTMVASGYAFGPDSAPAKAVQAIIVAWLEWRDHHWTEDQLFAWLRKALSAISDENGSLPLPPAQSEWARKLLGPDMADYLDMPF